VEIVDKTGEDRSNKDLIEAKKAIETELINMKNFGSILLYYPTIISAINELLKRRNDEHV
jgi:hypothetical protein